MREGRDSLSRRGFLGSAAALGAAAWTKGGTARASTSSPGARERAVRPPEPVAVSSANGLEAVAEAVARMRQGEKPVDAAVAGVNLVELDPNDTSVGYGGLPNERGVVELDSAVMDGPTHNGGAVASLQNIKTPSRVALLVMRRTDHCLLVGPGALEFARAHGFAEENLLTERARKRWLRWKENLSDRDDWFPPEEEEEGPRDTGTIHLSALDTAGDLGCVTTTSGLAFKIPGRVGDSPIIGAGLYLDNEVGSAGSTGRGESVILSCGSAMVVERMRAGRSPQEACLDVLERIAGQARANGLADEAGRPSFQVNFYAVAKDGRHGGAAMFEGSRYAVADAAGARREPSAWLFER